MTLTDRVESAAAGAPGASDGGPRTDDATRQVLFGRLHTEAAAPAVVRRLRTAIGLGVLAEGEKLPRETDLARQLGVTAFALREALGVLRAEGLIRTRVGKNGGSYVAHPPAGESLAGDELVRLSAGELRDLGDWRTALTTHASRLAAQRGAGTAGTALENCVRGMRAATGAAEARRALGRFHVELAAAAQSMRLTRAELALHEEFDWLTQVLLQAPEHRAGVADAMAAVAAAVGRGEVVRAWNASEQLVTDLVTGLARARLRMLADRHAGDRPAGGRGEAELAGTVRALLDGIVELLAALGLEVGAAFDQAPRARELNTHVDRSILTGLARVDDVVHGLGFMAEVSAVAETPYWMKWWQRTPDGTFDRDFSHQLDPARDDFYDYSTKDYLTRPRRSGQPGAMGPYIDHGGVDDNVVTISVPVRAGSGFVGIMAADVRVAGLETAVAPWLAQADGVCVLLNAESRVLLSNAVRYGVGEVVPAGAPLERTEVGRFGWTVGRGPATP